MRPFLLLAALGATGCGNTHPLLDGNYSFVRTEVIRDDCNQAGRPDLMAGGALQKYGHEVRFDTGFFDVKMIGVYLSSTENFRLDGSTANISAEVAGRQCVLDQVVLAIDANTVDPTHFDGTLSAKYEAGQPVDCDCQTWVRFGATRL